MVSLISLQELTSNEKITMAFFLYDSEEKGVISKTDFMKIFQVALLSERLDAAVRE